MSRITRINYVKQFRVFRSFAWSVDLPDFSRLNLVYGLNGSGKSALSTLFQNVQTKIPLLEGQAQCRIDDRDVSLNSISSQSVLPRIRVFNKSFIEQNVFAGSASEIPPIFYIGKNSVELQRRVENLQQRLAQEKRFKVDNESKLKNATKALDDFFIQEATTIREALRTPGKNSYNNYDKSVFKKAVTAQAKVEPPANSLDQQRKDELLAEARGSIKDSLDLISIDLPDVEVLTNEVGEALKQTVVSTVLAELAANPTVANWVKDGLTLHTGKNKSESCRFCGQTLLISRIEAMEAHFNDHFRRFSEDLNNLETRIETCKTVSGNVGAPDKAALYDHLTVKYSGLLQKLKEMISAMVAYLNVLLCAVREKRNNAFKSMDLGTFINPVLRFDRAEARDTIGQLNDVIEQHNRKTKNFASNIVAAQQNVEKAYVIDAVSAFKNGATLVDTLTSAVSANDEHISEIETEIGKLEGQFVEHRLPAEELTAELASYLGRNELKFEVEKSGYSIARDGIRATNLSEGERTAIAFLYFL